MDKNPLSLFAKIGAVAVGGFVTLSFASSLVVGGIRNVTEAKRKKTAPPCSVCDGRGFMQCKLCGGRATIEWSPLYDPVIIKPCVCPTCEGNSIAAGRHGNMNLEMRKGNSGSERDFSSKP